MCAHACVCTCVCAHACVYACLCTRMCVCDEHVGGGEGIFNITHCLVCELLLHNLSESLEVPLVYMSFLVLAMYASLSSYSLLADSSRWGIHKAYQADVSMDFHTRLKQPPKVKFDVRVSSTFVY